MAHIEDHLEEMSRDELMSLREDIDEMLGITSTEDSWGPIVKVREVASGEISMEDHEGKETWRPFKAILFQHPADDPDDMQFQVGVYIKQEMYFPQLSISVSGHFDDPPANMHAAMKLAVQQLRENTKIILETV